MNSITQVCGQGLAALAIFASGMQAAETAASINSAVVWRFQMGGPVVAPPVIDQGVVYCGVGPFYALDAATGEVRWKFSEAKFQIRSRAAVGEGVVCFESGNTVFALDAKDGKERWHFGAKPWRPIYSMDLTDYHRSAPVIADGRVWFGDDWGNVNAVDLATGALAWQYTTATARPIHAPVAVHEGIVYFGDWEGEVYAASIADRKLRWQHTMENMRPYYGAVVSDLVVDGGRLYFGSQHDTFTPLELASGQPAWKYVNEKHTYLPSTPLVHEGRVIIGTTIFANAVMSLDRGEVKWSFKGDGIFFTRPALHEGVLYINSSNFGGTGHLYALEVATGKLIRDLPIRRASQSSPAIADGRLFIGAGDGCVYALDLAALLRPEQGKGPEQPAKPPGA